MLHKSLSDKYKNPSKKISETVKLELGLQARLFDNSIFYESDANGGALWWCDDKTKAKHAERTIRIQSVTDIYLSKISLQSSATENGRNLYMFLQNILSLHIWLS